MSLPVSLLQRQPQAAQLPLDKLASNANVSEAEKLAEASTQFEAVLLRHIFTEAQKPVFKSKFSTESVATGIYRDLITSELAERASRTGGFGVARALEQQLQRQA
jgi:Rod binding domain-containing protein